MKNKTLQAFCFVGALSACSSAYYGTMEKFGVYKRDIMVDRVQDARRAQDDGEDQFTSALEAFKSVHEFDGGKLEKVYNTLNDEYEDSREVAEDISERIDAIESVANAMFREWRKELGEYSSDSLRKKSELRLKQTQVRYEELIAAMHQTESRMEPVLALMLDQVLFLKHNLNAQAIQSLKTEVPKIDADVDRLLNAMQEAIAQADAFVAEMKR
ncbi:putative lipoprotein [Teredinibacter turnerae T7901]|uniref:Lipoprotein n=1 Tax=Teredinibacter turnerae (strain ATCC 39867 / T7901) TaxID=377629 RepID=C5BUD3_TERTT|nr:DUF2959 domain-containing protein [Teredinibacter turnerae]ACR14385.1 putative lipoprotein [Teredinibacter turnerae T7901]